MAKGTKKKETLTPEEKLRQALVPVEEQPYPVPGNWCWTYIKTGYNVTSSKRIHKSDWKTEGVPFYRTRELVKLSEFGSVNNELFIDCDLYKELKDEYGVPQIGDILVSGVGTIGVPYIVNDTYPFYFKDGNVIWFQNKDLFLPEFIFYLYKSTFMYNQIHNMSAGTTVDTYTIINAMKTKIPLP
ncbi:MAG: restriction endonuclease subunit S, partial [Acidaminococcaceae bacterium]|nr:restriction endonuclease subunit S [Acidaminococcaceae bacterium]